MTASVRIEAEAWGDLRFATVARLCGLADLEHGLIRCAKIWSWQTENFTDEAPTYVVDVDTIESALGTGGAAAMVRARLAEETPEGFRIKGSVGRIEWLWKLRIASAKGGEATKRRFRNNSGPPGYPEGQPQAEPKARPIEGPLTPTLSLDPTGQRSEADLSSARAIPPRTAWQRRQAWWDQMLTAHRRLRDRGIEPNAADLPRAPAGPNETNIAKCETALRLAKYDEPSIDAKFQHAIQIAEAEAVRDGSLKFFKPASLFSPENFNRLVDTTLEQVGARKASQSRAGPRAPGSAIGAATPRNDHPDTPLQDFSELMK